jgi:hypothetical protein
MKELERFRQFLAEKKITEANDSQLQALMDIVSGDWASDVLQDGTFGTVSPFGNGEQGTPLMNVTKEIKSNFEFYKEDPDTDDFDLVKDDMKAVKEIARAVKKMGGRVAYGGDGLQYVYTVNGEGELLAQAIETDEEPEQFNTK